MKINHKKMHRDILVRLNGIDKTQEYLSKKLGMGRSTIWRLSKGKDISTTNFFKIIDWLDKGIEHYMIFERQTNKTLKYKPYK